MKGREGVILLANYQIFHNYEGEHFDNFRDPVSVKWTIIDCVSSFFITIFTVMFKHIIDGQ